MHTRTDNLSMQNVSLRTLIAEAYGLPDYRVLGPAWLDTDRFDVVAKAPHGTPSKEVPLLLAPLLAERFKLVSHRETKELPVYALVVAKGGLKIKQSEGTESKTNGHGNKAGGELTAGATTMAWLAEWLSKQVDRPVLDMTGDTRRYDFTLKYSREDAKAETADTAYPIVPLAIQDQIGVRLEKRNAALDVLVVDSIEKLPIEN